MTTASGLNALIVEDNATFRRFFKDFLLGQYPFLRIAEAGDAVEATREIEALVPDLIFMDIRLPGMSGMQLTKQIKARHPQVKIVIVTNHGEREFLAEALASKADGFFLKETVSGEEFSALIESISSEMGIDSGGLGVRSLSGAPPSDQPEAQSDEEEGNGQRLTKVGLQFA